MRAVNVIHSWELPVSRKIFSRNLTSHHFLTIASILCDTCVIKSHRFCGVCYDGGKTENAIVGSSSEADTVTLVGQMLIWKVEDMINF